MVAPRTKGVGGGASFFFSFFLLLLKLGVQARHGRSSARSHFNYT